MILRHLYRPPLPRFPASPGIVTGPRPVHGEPSGCTHCDEAVGTLTLTAAAQPLVLRRLVHKPPLSRTQSGWESHLCYRGARVRVSGDVGALSQRLREPCDLINEGLLCMRAQCCFQLR